MDIKTLKEIVNSDASNELKEKLIINCLASDENAISNVLKILHEERKNKSELIRDMNAELSRAHIYIEINKEDKTEKTTFNKDFIMEVIKKFYTKYKHVVTHCFNRFN